MSCTAHIGERYVQSQLSRGNEQVFEEAGKVEYTVLQL